MANNEEIKITLTDNTVPVTIGTAQNDPFYVGAKAVVEQLENGAQITCTDKDGKTVALV